MIRPIGHGAYGVVVAVNDTVTKRHLAIKRINKAFEDPIDGKRILREIKLMKRWTHENVISWGQYRELMPEHVLVDRQFLNNYPQVEASFAKSKVRDYLKLLDKAGNLPTRKRGGKGSETH